jgi:mRNA-degrading endonuclease YafQ of YafQ-DinJ toxin-antitoxin module
MNDLEAMQKEYNKRMKERKTKKWHQIHIKENRNYGREILFNDKPLIKRLKKHKLIGDMIGGV